MYAGVAELADAQASGACGRKIVWVQVPSPAFFHVRFFTFSLEILSFFKQAYIYWTHLSVIVYIR